jgi:hypothetical protein
MNSQLKVPFTTPNALAGKIIIAATAAQKLIAGLLNADVFSLINRYKTIPRRQYILS